MIRLLAVRNLTLKPWRTLFLLFGFSMGVAVMIVLLSIGEALLEQSKDEKLVGGGTITVLPEGVDIEVLKTGGLGGLFFSIDHARFIYQQLLAAPRLSDAVSAVSPQIDGKLVYLRTADGRERAVRASGDIPSLHGGSRRRSLADEWQLERRLARPSLALSDAVRAPTRDRSFPPTSSRSGWRPELGGVALLQRHLSRQAAVGVHLVHARRSGR